MSDNNIFLKTLYQKSAKKWHKSKVCQTLLWITFIYWLTDWQLTTNFRFFVKGEQSWMKSFLVGTTFKVFPYFQGNAPMTSQQNYLLFNSTEILRRFLLIIISQNDTFPSIIQPRDRKRREEEIMRKLWERWKGAISTSKNTRPSLF